MSKDKSEPQTERAALIAQAQELGVKLDSNESIADLRAKIFQAQANPDAVVTNYQIVRYKTNRGSGRRISRALEALNAALDAAILELGQQAYMADMDGNRIADWPVVTTLRETRAVVNAEVSDLIAAG